MIDYQPENLDIVNLSPLTLIKLKNNLDELESRLLKFHASQLATFILLVSTSVLLMISRVPPSAHQTEVWPILSHVDKS